MRKFKDLTSLTFGRLKVLKLLDRTESNIIRYLVQCQCLQKTIFSVSGISLTRKDRSTKSCGCLQKESVTSHGMVGTRFHRIWNHMKTRVTDKKQKNYNNRGITVCESWNEFINFRDDMYQGYLKHVKEFGEENTSIDRIDVNGNYNKENCRWATRKEQSQNTRVSSITVNYIEHSKWKRRLYQIVNNAITTFKVFGNSNSLLFKKSIGCSVLEFIYYIENQFNIDMNWNNHGRGLGTWQVDHIVGINNFDLSKEEDRKKCFHYTNLRPMYHEVHIIKSKQRVINEH